MSEADPAGLRTAMVDGIVDWWRGIGGSPPLNPRVLQAMQTVARHEFAPAAELAAAYALDTVPLKHGPGGRMVSCLSNPSIVAVMLHQLDARPGQRVLEIGAGGGYQAALLAELVAPGGRVTTVDIDPDIAATARRNLTAAGYGDTDVTVQAGNGAAALRGGVFDRVIAAVGPWDLPTAWVQQLVEGGRMVVPLRLRGSSRLLALTRRRDRLVCDDVQMGGFVPMAGPGQGGEQHATIHDPDGTPGTTAAGEPVGAVAPRRCFGTPGSRLCSRTRCTGCCAPRRARSGPACTSAATSPTTGCGCTYSPLSRACARSSWARRSRIRPRGRRSAGATPAWSRRTAWPTWRSGGARPGLDGPSWGRSDTGHADRCWLTASAGRYAPGPPTGARYQRSPSTPPALPPGQSVTA